MKQDPTANGWRLSGLILTLETTDTFRFYISVARFQWFTRSLMLVWPESSDLATTAQW